MVGALFLFSAMTQHAEVGAVTIGSGYTYTFSDNTTYAYTDGVSDSGTGSIGETDAISLNGGTLTFSDQNINFSGHDIEVAAASTIDLAVLNFVYGTIFGSFSGTESLTLKKDALMADPITTGSYSGTKTVYQYFKSGSYYFTSATAIQDAASSPTYTGTLSSADVLVFKGGTIYPNALSLVLPNAIQIATDSMIDTTNHILTLSGEISGTGALSLPSTDVTKYLTVSQACPNYTGTLTLSVNGMIEFGVENCMSNASIVNEKIVDLNGHSQTIKNLSGAGSLVSYPDAGTTGTASQSSDAVSLTVNLTTDKIFTGTLDASVHNLNLVSGNANTNSFTLDASTAQNNITGTTSIGEKVILNAKFSLAKPVSIAANGELDLLDDSQLSKLTNSGTVDLKGKNLSILGSETTNDLGTVTTSTGDASTLEITLGDGTSSAPTVALGTACVVPLNVKNGSTLKVTGNISLPKFTVS